MSEPLILRSDDGPVAVLTLNRPDKRNALSRALMRELEHHLDRVGHDSRVRTVVLTGAGSVFCSGMDLKEAAAERDGSEAEQHAVATLLEYADLIQKLHALPKLTIAAVNGDALAGGAGLMAACDFAVASSMARIGYPEVLRGLVPAVVMFDLTRLIGDRRTRQLLLTGGPDSCQRGQLLGAGEPGHGTGELPFRSHPRRQGHACRRASGRCGHQAAARRDPGPSHEPSRSRGRQRRHPGVRGGPGRHSRIP